MNLRRTFVAVLCIIMFRTAPALVFAQTTTSTSLGASILQEFINELQYIEQIIMKLEAAPTKISTVPTPMPVPITVPPATTSAPVIVTLDPSSGPIGTMVTIGGDNFGIQDNIHFGGGGFYDVMPQTVVFNCPMMLPNSSQTCGGYSQTLTFTVPSSLGAYCPPGEAIACPMYEMLVAPNTYNISVQNAASTSNTMTFTVIDTSAARVR
jgi:hypothetical protein